MTAPLPSPALSPTAGLFNAVLRLYIARLAARITELRLLIAIETEAGYALRTTRNFADSERSGYVNRTGIEA